MIQPTSYKGIVFVLAVLQMNIGCKNNLEVSNENKIVSDSLVPKSIGNKSHNEKEWLFFKTVPISNSYSCTASDEAKLVIIIKNDSIVSAMNVEEKIYSGKIKTKSFLKRDYVYQSYKEILMKEFRLQLPDTIDYIRLRSFENDSQLKSHFTEAFFVKDYMFFEKNGCLVCFKETDTQLTNVNCLDKKNVTLPYSKKHSDEKENFKTTDCTFSGGEDWFCGNEKLRYKHLFSQANISLILVPMDCGDFSDRYYILTINENKIISDLYAEGEWYEPEDNNYKEISSFSIDKNKVITIKLKKILNNVVQSEENTIYEISKDGSFKKLK